tara:strand:+ start:490 stop:888 length:399 start_codon:yes stop_codon:yes gene_type:complete
MARSKSLATLILQHSDDRSYKLTYKKIPQIYNILNRHIFCGKLKKPKIEVRRIHGALGYFEFNPYATKYCHKITLNNNFKNFREFVEILGHEMIHYYQKLILKQNTAKHNRQFYSFRRKFKKLGLSLKRVYH